jgi:cell division protein FtsN
MSKDYKPRQNNTSRPKGGGLLLGLFIGFLLGLGAAAAIAVYVFKTPTPFAARTAPPAKTDSGTVNNAAKAEPKQPLTFYKILPGQEEPVTEKQLKEAARDAAKLSPAAAQQLDSGDLPKDKYFIQAGAFQNPADADNLKAKLALLGLEAGVEPSEIPDKGTWYRVRLGPFLRIEEINRVRSQLAQNGIDASLVKIRDAAPKP